MLLKYIPACVRCSVRRLATQVHGPKRFYEKVTVIQAGTKSQDGIPLYEIVLDKRKVKTPKGVILQVPGEPMALSMAQEWSAQGEYLDIAKMHLNGLAISVVDNPLNTTKQAIVERMLNFLPTDTVFFMSSEPGPLKTMQMNEWGELIDWAKETYEIGIQPTDTIQLPDIPQATYDKLRRKLNSYNIWAINGYQFSVEAVKSVLIAMATVDGRLSVQSAIHLSNLEQHYQTEQWGRVEWAHDVELHDTTARFTAGLLMTKFMSSATYRQS